MKEVIPDYDKYYLWGHEIEDGTWPDFSSTNVGYIERNLVNRLYNLKVSLENTVSYLSHCFPIFTVTAFNLHKSSVRWVGWVELSFWPPEGRWRCWVRPPSGLPREHRLVRRSGHQRSGLPVWLTPASGIWQPASKEAAEGVCFPSGPSS